MKLTIHVHLVLKLNVSGAISPLSLMHSMQLYLLHNDHTWRLQVLTEVLTDHSRSVSIYILPCLFNSRLQM